MEEKKYKAPPVSWLKVADYMQPLLKQELGCSVKIGDQTVLCIQHLPKARNILRMETVIDTCYRELQLSESMSSTKRKCIASGFEIDSCATEQIFNINKNEFGAFIPIECPKICTTAEGVLRPWTPDTAFGREQANALQVLLRDVFWKSLSDFSTSYSLENSGRKYNTAEMIESFCSASNTPYEYVQIIRREWQRRKKGK